MSVKLLTRKIFKHKVVFWLFCLMFVSINSIGQTKQEIYDKINQERILRGLSLIPVDRKLEKSAQSWAFFMPYRGVHNVNFRKRFKRSGGECIAWGDSPVEGWMNSKYHKPMLIGKEVKAMGLGYWRAKWVLRTFTQ